MAASPGTRPRWEPGLRDAVKALLWLRRSEPALRDGPIRFLWADGSAVVYERGAGAGRFVVAVNAGDSAVRAELDLGGVGGGRLDPVALPGFGGVAGAPIVDGRASVELPARSGCVLRLG